MIIAQGRFRINENWGFVNAGNSLEENTGNPCCVPPWGVNASPPYDLEVAKIRLPEFIYPRCGVFEVVFG